LNDIFELYTNLPEGGNNLKVTGGIVAVTGKFEWLSDSSRIVLMGEDIIFPNPSLSNRSELYSVLPTGSAGILKISGPMIPNGSVRSFELAP
jgi:hypothetical protein